LNQLIAFKATDLWQQATDFVGIVDCTTYEKRAGMEEVSDVLMDGKR